MSREKTWGRGEMKEEEKKKMRGGSRVTMRLDAARHVVHVGLGVWSSREWEALS